METPPVISESPPLIHESTGLAKPVWGFWATLGFGAATGVAMLVVQVAFVVVYIAALTVLGKQPSDSEMSKLLERDGLLLGVITIFSAPAMAGLPALFARLRNGLSLRDYLGLRWPTIRQAVMWTIGIAILIVVGDSITLALGRPIVPDVMVETYRNTAIKPVLWIAIVLAAPIGEEILFRGFLLPGWKASRLGNVGAVVLSGAIWSLIHFQYDAYGIAMIFVSSLLLGFARLQTNSVLLCILLHSFMNLFAMIETEYCFERI